MVYAAKTSVPLSQSLAEIEKTVRARGYVGFVNGVSDDAIVIAFASDEGRQVRFIVPIKAADDALLAAMKAMASKASAKRPASIDDAWQMHRRQLGRALLLTIKAKLECIDAGIETFDDAFMSQLSLPGGGTVGQAVKTEIRQLYAGGATPPRLLPAPYPPSTPTGAA